MSLIKKKADILTPIQNAIRGLMDIAEVGARIEYKLSEKDINEFRRQVRHYEEYYLRPIKSVATDIKVTYELEKSTDYARRKYDYNKQLIQNKKNKKHDTDIESEL